MAKTERIKPITKDPVSPINILAGLKLNFRKANNEPTRVKEIIAICISLFNKKAIPKKIEAIVPKPPASPSIQSIKLYALVITTTTKIVKIREAHSGIS